MKKALSYPLTLLYYLCFGITLSIFHGVQIICLRIFGYQAHKKSVDLLNWVILRCLNLLGTRFVLHNIPKLKRDSPIIIVANHQSTYDIPPLIWNLRNCHPKFISKKELGRGIPSISYNLKYGGSILIDRNDKAGSLESIKSFAQKVRENNWSVVIFAEGTRSRDGNPKSFQKGGLITLFKEIPNARLLPISIGNSWQLSRFKYFPIPLGISIVFKFHPLQMIDSQKPKKSLESLQKIIHQGVYEIQSKI